MSKYKYRAGCGRAFSKRKDVELFENMARVGYKPIKLNWFGIYKFAQCEPEDVMYAVDCTGIKSGSDDFDSYKEIFNGGCWEYVYGKGGCNFFKAPKGTTPIYTDGHNESQMHRIIAKKLFPLAFASFLAFLLLVLKINLLGKSDMNPVFWGLACASAVSASVMIAGVAMCYYRANSVKNN